MSEFLSSSTPSVLISKPNIGKRILVKSVLILWGIITAVFKAAMVSDEDDVFPSAADLVNSTVNTINNKISGMVNIPKSLITSVREKLGGLTYWNISLNDYPWLNLSDNVQIVHILMNSLQDFLPTEDVKLVVYSSSSNTSIIVVLQWYYSNRDCINRSEWSQFFNFTCIQRGVENTANHAGLQYIFSQCFYSKSTKNIIIIVMKHQNNDAMMIV